MDHGAASRGSLASALRVFLTWEGQDGIIFVWIYSSKCWLNLGVDEKTEMLVDSERKENFLIPSSAFSLPSNRE